jgi:hypothetical protein
LKRTLIILSLVLLPVFLFHSCEDKKPNNSGPHGPEYYYPINFKYKWTYARLNTACQVSDDSFSVSALDRRTRELEDIGTESGWDLLPSGGGTTFVYQKGDSIFVLEIGSTKLPAKVLVGPIEEGNFWKDARGYEYVISGFEDIYSEASGGYYWKCVKIRRTMSGDSKKSDFWWAPKIGNVKRTEIDLEGHCVSGEELRRFDSSSEFP